jgi:DNA-binding transcriptional ArsR family regulator
MDPGDDYILNVLCECGCQATPETTTGDDGDEHRAHGRGFVGPDAEIAAEILASVRENEVAQAVGRYARNPEKEDDHAVVYVRTDATPRGFTDVQVDGVHWTATEKQREIIESLQNNTESTAKEIAEGLDVTKRHVLKTLNRLRARGLIECEEGVGSYGADLFRSIGGVTKSSVTKLGPTYITNNASIDPSTWSFVILGADDTDTGVTHYESSSSPNTIANTLSVQAPSPIQPPTRPQEPTETASSQSEGRWIVNGDVVAL